MSSEQKTTSSIFVQKTLKDVTYFPPGTRRHAYLYYLQNFGIANLIVRTVLAPIERWRIVRQTQHSLISNRVPEKGFLEFAAKIPKEEGVLGLWKGNGANCWLYFWQVSMQFLLFENINNFWRWQTTSTWEKKLASIGSVLSASCITLLVTYPIETARVRISNEFVRRGDNRSSRGVIDMLSKIRRRENISSVYKGYWIGVLTSALYFFTYQLGLSLSYEQRQQQGSNTEEQLKVTTNETVWNPQISFESAIANPITTSSTRLAVKEVPLLSSAQTAFILLVATLTAYPLDTIKHRLQLNNQGVGMLHLNARHLVRQIFKEESVVSLYRGLPATLFKQLAGLFLMRDLIKYKQQNGLNYF